MQYWLVKLLYAVLVKMLSSTNELVYDIPDFASLEYQFQRLSGCYTYLYDEAKKENSELPHHMNEEWWKTAGLYIKTLRRALGEVKELEPADPYLLASFNCQLLVAIGAGLCKDVSYVEIETACNEIEAAVKACAAWAPPLWKLDKAADIKIIKGEVLPFIRKVKPHSYKTETISTFTPGFLELYTRYAVFSEIYSSKNLHTCACCRIETVDLRKCTGVGFF